MSFHVITRMRKPLKTDVALLLSALCQSFQRNLAFLNANQISTTATETKRRIINGAEQMSADFNFPQPFFPTSTQTKKKSKNMPRNTSTILID